MLAVVLAGCGTHDTLNLGQPGSTPTPSATPTGSGTPTGTPATPTPTPVSTPFATGNGQDGTLVVSAPTQPNVCHVVTLGTGSTLSLDSTAGLTAGDAVLVTQVQENLAAPSGGAGAVGNTGRWELARIATVGATVDLLSPLANGYHSGTNAHAQACFVPEYTDLTISAGGSLTAAPWDGATGGVIAVMVNGTLTLDGTIDAKGAGFRGGATPANSSTAHQTAPDIAGTSGGGGKGESIDGRAFGMGGRGNVGNGGGGGNPYVAGGAGGGNGGAGGAGGLEFKDAVGGPNANTGGIGGTPLAANARLWLGGGGGAGAVDLQKNSSGGAGGGAILLVVHALSGAGSIRADGNAGRSETTFDKVAAGGGGAGGSLLVIADLPAGFSGTVSVVGGGGGSCTADGAGPGGGGGGGRVYQPAALSGATITRTGGTNGLGSSNGARGAAPGAVGIIEP